MIEHSPAATRVRFGLFEADLQTGELWKAGHKVKLQGQPFRVLATLVEHPGEVVTREQLQERLWGRDAAGDFDQSLGTAINKVREALGDSADNPRFVETLARRGYRFIAPVAVSRTVPAEDLLSAAASVATNPLLTGSLEPQPKATVADLRLTPRDALPVSVDPKPPRYRSYLGLAVAAVVLATIAAATGYLAGIGHPAAIPRIERLTHTGRIAPGVQLMESFPASVTDGLRIFTSVISGGRPILARVDVHTGEVQHFEMPSEISSPMLGDLSPDGGSLLLRSHLSPESEQPLWVVPTAGGSALRLSNIVAHDATWMLGGQAVLYAAGNELTIHQLRDGSSRQFATLPGRAFWLRWSPDGKLLRFTLLNPVDHTAALWQMDGDGRNARQILSNWTQASTVCCGNWTGDGKYFVFQANLAGNSDLWRIDGTSTSGPTRITNGPLSFVAPATSRNGHQIYFLGLETQSALLQFDPTRKAFVPEQEFLSDANRIEYSRDQQWVSWTDQSGRLWRARPDGSERIQVTPDSLDVFLAHWSPDGQQLALMARHPGKAWQLYIVAPAGGTPLLLTAENRNQADPSWSANGQQIVFGRITDIMGKEEGARALQIFDLMTGKVSAVPESDGLFSPRWSPDGKYIAAISLDQKRLMLLDLATGVWQMLADTSVADPVWSADSKSIIFHAAQADMQPIYRVAIADGKLEQIANLSNFADGETADYFFCGLTPAGRPIVRSRIGTGDVYSLNLDAKAADAR